VPTEPWVRQRETQQLQNKPPPKAVTEARQQPAAIDRSIGRSWLDAARAGDLPVLQGLLQQQPQLLNYQGAGISYAFVGNSALHWAAAKGHKACVAWLLQQRAAVGAVNEAGATVLHTAVEHGQAGCAEVLVLAGGADLQAQDGYGQSVLSIAGARTGGCSRGGGVVCAEQLLLWEEARKLQQQDRWGRVGHCCGCCGHV
jgi:ankyrin repeat protein